MNSGRHDKEHTITGADDGFAVTGAVVGSADDADAIFTLDLLAGATDADTSDTLRVTNLTRRMTRLFC